MKLSFHPLVQQDLNTALRYYIEEGGAALGDRFWMEIGNIVEKIASNPERFHFVHQDIRRANLTNFPYHFLFRVTPTGVRVLVLRHHRRHPSTGSSRT